jgi:hypothetical protein
LLDWLADEFVRSGWSIKHLHRLIVGSATWRMSVSSSPKATQQDPENKLWSHFNRQRMDAESLRDSLLFVAGKLDLTQGGSLIPPSKNPMDGGRLSNVGKAVDPSLFQTNRRSLYLPVVRSEVYEVLSAFDFADPSTVSGERQSTIVAPQALFLMNHRFVAENARSMAEAILREESTDDARIQGLYLRVLGRTARPEEREAALRFLTRYSAAWTAAQPERTSEAGLRSWQSLCRSLLSSNEFLFVE